MNDNQGAPPVPQEKKGIPVLGWVGIGCGTILIIVIIAVSLLIGWCKRTVGDLGEFQRNPEKAAAEMMVRLSPDLDMVSQDEAKGEMTIRTKDGETITMSYKDIAEGKFRMKDAQGNTTEFGNTDLSNLPSWVPRVPEMKSTTLSTQSVSGDTLSGLYSATSAQSAEQLESHFKTEAEKLGADSSGSSSTNVNGSESRMLSFEGKGRKLTIVITAKPGEDTMVNVGYEGPK
jgi:hypothetical protein